MPTALPGVTIATWVWAWLHIAQKKAAAWEAEGGVTSEVIRHRLHH